MAKSKKRPAAKPAEQPKRRLTDGELARLAPELLNKQGNIYRQVEQMFPGAACDDSTFERLRSRERIFKCDGGCNQWLPLAEESDIEDYCVDCNAELVDDDEL